MPRKSTVPPPPTPSLSTENIPVPEASQSGSIDQEIESNVGSESPGVIIIHPGSCTLRLGLSSQLDPHSIPHIIAYRKYETTPTSQVTTPSFLQYPSLITAPLISERDKGLNSIMKDVTETRARHDIYDAESDVTQYNTLNADSTVIPCNDDDEVSFQWSDTSTSPQFVIGNEALSLHPSSPYVIYKPLKCGCLNVSPSISRSAVLKQLEDLWCRAIEECLDIPKKEFKFYRVILCTPDMIDRLLYKDYIDILLNHLNFEAALIHQESVCATYGAGVSAACVIDIGEDRTSICCVEDGMSNVNTRLTLKYGGNDITRFFYWILQRANFPYNSCSEESLMDGNLISKLKERYCHFDLTVWGVAEEEVIVPHIGKGGVKFIVHFADELVYAPMGIYYPKVFCLPNTVQLMYGQESQSLLNEDIYDEANWGSEQNTLLKGSSNSTGSKNNTENNQSINIPTEITRRIKTMDSGHIMGLDDAVHFSIDCTSSEDTKRKLYSSILLIGGGLSFSHGANVLKSRLQTSLPSFLKGSSDLIEVCSNPRDLSPSNVSWRGGAVLAALDCCSELWIERQDWELFGVRLLREKSLFVW